jgi:ATP-binding cassette subfamily B protein
LLVVMARIDLTLAAMALVLCVPLFWLAHTCSRRIRTYSHRVKELDSSAMGVVQETLSLLRVVKVFSQEQREYQRFLGISQKRMDSQVKTALIQARFHVAVGLTISLGMAAGIYVGAEQVRAGEMSLGALLVAIAYMAQIYEPLRILSTKVPDLQSWLASTERALALFEQSPEIEDRADARPLARARGEIEFCGVSVRHGEQVVMENVSFKVAPGVRIGIIGPTGSGKSTLLSLLTRFQDPASGCILLDGCDLRAYRLADLRKQCAVVLQEPLLFSTTLAENIAYGKPSASREEIIEVARRARAHDFIVALPNGYDTEPGERGLQLSGGERQRIALARALLMNAPLLLLDEPTSSVDPHTEKLIMEAIDEIAAGRTTFIVAHRLSTLKKCDALLLVCGGTAQFYTTELDTVIEQLTEGPYPDMQRFRRSE